jgi:hypothetical protein
MQFEYELNKSENSCTNRDLTKLSCGLVGSKELEQKGEKKETSLSKENDNNTCNSSQKEVMVGDHRANGQRSDSSRRRNTRRNKKLNKKNDVKPRKVNQQNLKNTAQNLSSGKNASGKKTGSRLDRRVKNKTPKIQKPTYNSKQILELYVQTTNIVDQVMLPIMYYASRNPKMKIAILEAPVVLSSFKMIDFPCTRNVLFFDSQDEFEERDDTLVVVNFGSELELVNTTVISPVAYRPKVSNQHDWFCYPLRSEALFVNKNNATELTLPYRVGKPLIRNFKKAVAFELTSETGNLKFNPGRCTPEVITVYEPPPRRRFYPISSYTFFFWAFWLWDYITASLGWKPIISGHLVSMEQSIRSLVTNHENMKSTMKSVLRFYKEYLYRLPNDSRTARFSRDFYGSMMYYHTKSVLWLQQEKAKNSFGAKIRNGIVWGKVTLVVLFCTVLGYSIFDTTLITETFTCADLGLGTRDLVPAPPGDEFKKAFLTSRLRLGIYTLKGNDCFMRKITKDMTLKDREFLWELATEKNYVQNNVGRTIVPLGLEVHLPASGGFGGFLIRCLVEPPLDADPEVVISAAGSFYQRTTVSISRPYWSYDEYKERFLAKKRKANATLLIEQEMFWLDQPWEIDAEFSSDILDKSDETLAKAKPRNVNAVHKAAIVRTAPQIEYAMECLKADLKDSVYQFRRYSRGFKYIIASGMNIVDLTQMVNQILPIYNIILFAGDDMLAIIKHRGKIHYVMNDYSKYDQTQSAETFQAAYGYLHLLGLSDAVEVLEKSHTSQFVFRHKDYILKFHLDRIQQLTGQSDTTFTNTLVNMIATTYVLAETNVLNRSIEHIGKFFAKFGFVSKLHRDNVQGEFLKFIFRYEGHVMYLIPALGPVLKNTIRKRVDPEVSDEQWIAEAMAAHKLWAKLEIPIYKEFYDSYGDKAKEYKLNPYKLVWDPADLERLEEFENDMVPGTYAIIAELAYEYRYQITPRTLEL